MSKDKSKEIRDYLDSWLSRRRSEAKLVPFVQRAYEAAVWQHNTWMGVSSYMPNEVRENVENRMAQAFNQLQANLPLPPDYSSVNALTLTTTVTGSTMSVYGSVLTLPDFQNVSLDVGLYVVSYQSLLQNQNRRAEVQRLLAQKLGSLVTQFDLATTAFETAKSQRDQVPAAAIELRTLLDMLKGQLFERARRFARENMTWEQMAERLGTIPDADSARVAICGQEFHRSGIYESLSRLAKRRGGNELQELEALWPLILDHLLVACGSIEDEPSA